MLLSFSVENFRSFAAEETFNLLADKRLKIESPHCCAVPGTDEHALRVASLYGANGAGKSNLVRALDFLKQLVLLGTPPGEPIPYEPFLMDDESRTKPSSFELQFLQQDEVFRYGACFDANRVHEEWLAVYEGKKERNLFTRVGKEDGTVTVTLEATAKGADHPKKIQALSQVGARANQLFLTEVVNLDDPEAQGPHFRKAIKWFVSTLATIDANSRFTMLAETIAADEMFAEFAARFLREANTGIAHLEVQTTEVPRSRPPSKLFGMMRDMFRDSAERREAVVRGLEGKETPIDSSREDLTKQRKIMALHDGAKGRQIRLPLREESDGSQRLLHLLPALYRLTAEGGVFVVDELERSMHPMLARKFIEFFLEADPGGRSQLIFTTHESTLLDLDLVRRDGIWFAEKDQKGASHLYSLADFKVRKDLKLDKGYFAGRFGAIPFLGGIDRLIEEQAAAETEA